MSESIWSDEPPTEAGWYWIKDRSNGSEGTAYVHPSQTFYVRGLQRRFLFGPRVPSAVQCVGLERMPGWLNR